MVRFGIIGTNWITDIFLNDVMEHPEFTIGAIYSRTEEKGRAFAEKYDVKLVYTDMEEMFQSGEIDAVYIATPNFLHAQQSILAMQNGIHVLCEKPAVTTVSEMEEVIQTSKTHQVTYMEAMKSTVLPTFINLTKHLDKVGQIRRLVFHYNQYSSRYDNYKKGIIENAFKPELGNGARMDLGVYCLAPLIHLVDEPKSVVNNSYFLSTGAEGQGSMILNYGEFEAVIMYSKITDSYYPSEIQGEEGIIEIDEINDPKQVTIRYRDGRTEDISVEHEHGGMYYELAEFISTVNKGEIESSINTHERSLKVTKLLTV